MPGECDMDANVHYHFIFFMATPNVDSNQDIACVKPEAWWQVISDDGVYIERKGDCP